MKEMRFFGGKSENIMNVLIDAKNRFFSSKHQKTVKKWKELNKDERLRLNCPNLDGNSIVFDLGGYKGQWASDIYSKYNCTICVFEPVREFYEFIKERFKNNWKIRVFNFGLASSNRKEVIFLNEDGSSLYGKGKRETINLFDFEEFLKKEKIKKINLVKSNIEGAEYELLEYLISKGVMKNIEVLEIQFHRNIRDYLKRYKRIRNNLKNTHHLKYSFPFVWESWVLKE